MKARNLLQSTSYEPAQMKLIGQAFDQAWDAVAKNYGEDAPLIEDARLRLAEAILQHAPTFWDDVEGLKKVALRQLNSQVP